MLGRILTMYKLSNATQIVKAALRFMPMTPFDVEVVAPKLVANVYASKRELFDGSVGPRPHAISTAAIALAQGVEDRDFDSEFPKTALNHVFLALGNVLLDVSRNSVTYGLRDLDVRMIRIAEGVYLAHEEQTREKREAVVGSLSLSEDA